MTIQPSIRLTITGLIVLISLTVSLSDQAWSYQVQQNRSQGDDGLTQAPTWKISTLADAEFAFEDWLKQSNFNVEATERVKAFLVTEFQPDAAGEIVDSVIDGIVIARPDVNELRDRLRSQRSSSQVPDFSSLLNNPDEKDFLRDHVRLYFARWLAQNDFYDEALSHLETINVDDVLDPSTLLFYRGLVEHQLLKKDKCVETIERLLENSQQLPRRYEVLARLMLADIQPMEPDTLDEITRLMSDIRRRTGLFRSGKQVLDEEETVIKKLDKLIENLESQQQAQQVANNISPGSPMEDSFKAGGKGDGEVTSKTQSEGGDWGDLPPADRAAALAEMAKDMPPHYRAVIEEYFRQLAKENDR